MGYLDFHGTDRHTVSHENEKICVAKGNVSCKEASPCSFSFSLLRLNAFDKINYVVCSTPSLPALHSFA